MKCGLPDGRVYDAVLVGLDPTGDVALIKLLGARRFPPRRTGRQRSASRRRLGLRHGQPLPAGHRLPAHRDLRHRFRDPSLPVPPAARCWNTPIAFRPTPRSTRATPAGRCSTWRAALVGINGRGSFEKRGRVSVGVGYAISSQPDQELHRLPAERPHRRSRHPERAGRQPMKAAASSSADILEQSDAYRRGLRLDDELVSFGGRPITTPNGFKNVLGIFPKGWRVPLSFRRDGKRYDVTVRLAGLHSSADLLEKYRGAAAAGTPMPIPKPGEQPGRKAGRHARSGRRPSQKTPSPRSLCDPMARSPRRSPCPRSSRNILRRSPASPITISTSSIRSGCGRPGRPGPTSPGGAAPGPSTGDLEGRTKVRLSS